MILRTLVALTAVLLAACSGQRGQTQVMAQAQPAASEPANPPSPIQPVAAEQSPATPNDPGSGPATLPGEDAGAPTVAAAQPFGPPVSSAPPAPISDASVVAEPHAHRTIVLPPGTRIRVRLDQTLDTKYTRAGSTFQATLEEPIVEGDRVVVPRHTRFSGEVVASKRSGRFRGRAYLHVALRSFRLNGVKYRIATATDSRASGSHKKRNLALVGGGSATGAGIGAIAGGGAGALIGAGVGAAAGATTEFITGKKDVRLPAETPMVFSLRVPIQIKPA